MGREINAFQQMLNDRFGMFVHFGLFSMLARGEWVMNREQIPPAQMKEYAKTFNPEKFNSIGIKLAKSAKIA